MSRRSPGEGSVQRDGDRWKAVLRHQDPKTGEKRRSVRRARTKTEAVHALRQLKSEIATNGTLSDGRTTIDDACMVYLEMKKGQGLAAGSIRAQSWMVGIIADGLGGRRLGQLTVADCDTFLRNAAAGIRARRAIGPDHLRRTRSMLIAVIANAERTGQVSRNVAQHSILPNTNRAGRAERNVLSRSDLADLLSQTDITALGSVVRLCGIVGLRPAEARALLWSDIDMTNGTIAVVKQLDERSQPTAPKTRRASRRIAVPAEIVVAPRSWRKAQASKQLAAGEFWHDRNLVVCTDVGTPFNKDNLRRDLKRACISAGIQEITPYELRHTAITNLSNEGHTNWQLADYTGTSTRMIEDTYRHRTEGVVSLDPVRRSGSAGHHLRHQ